MNIAAIQLDITWENRSANYDRVKRLLDQKKLPDNSLIVLPEMFDVGFSMNISATNPGNPSQSELFCQTLARDRNCTIVAGVVAQFENRKYSNEVVGYLASGEKFLNYRKMRSFTPSNEHRHYEKGIDPVTVELNGWRIRPLICYDLRFPELFRMGERRESDSSIADLYIVVANWPASRSLHWKRLLQARAIENQAYVLGVNRTGTDPFVEYAGESCLFDPFGNPIFVANADEQIVDSNIDLQVVQNWRQQFPALRDANPKFR